MYGMTKPTLCIAASSNRWILPETDISLHKRSHQVNMHRCGAKSQSHLTSAAKQAPESSYPVKRGTAALRAAHAPNSSSRICQKTVQKGTGDPINPKPRLWKSVTSRSTCQSIPEREGSGVVVRSSSWNETELKLLEI